MKKQYLFIVAILVSLCGNLFSQTYQLSGNPVNATGWGLVSSASINGDFIQLTPNQNNTSGGIKLNAPINLKYCNKWKVEFDFRIDGAADPTYGKGDGLAFWYITNPPTSYISGGGLGIPNNAEGLMIGFDTYNNYTESLMSKVHILYGTNNVSSNIEMNNTAGSTYHSNDLLSTIPFITGNYRHVEVNGEIDPANAANWIITVKIDNHQIVSQSFQPSGGAVNMTQGYFGFSASTGGATSRHSIKNAKIYVDKVSLLQNTITATKCVNASSSATVDLTSFNSQLVSNPANYIFTYYILGSSTPISNPTNFQYSTNTTIKVIIKDPTSTLCDTEAQIQLNTTTLSPPTITSSSNTICFGGNVTLTSSQATGNTWSTGATTPSITVTTPGTYTVTNTNGGCTSAPASITIAAESNPNVQITGNTVLCESPTQLTASASGTGNTYTWSNGSTGNTISVSTPGTYTVTVKTPSNCEYQKSITVTQGVVPVVQNASLSQCSNSSTAVFNLTSAQTAISTTAGVTFDFYLNQADAVAGNSNTINNPTTYTSGNTTIYVRVKSATCAKVAQLQLNITQSGTVSITSSSNTICFGGNVTLTSSQATGNTWSNGATTQSITVTSAGTYTLTNNGAGCATVPASITITAESNPNVQIAGNTILCDTPTQLTASAAGTGNVYTWSNGSTGNTISVSTAGTYTVTVKTPANCEYQKSITVTQGVVPVVQNASLSQCSNSSTAVFNLTSAQPSISTTSGVTFDFYLNQADAMAGNSNTINNLTVYTSGNATIYVRVKSATCSKVAQLQLNINTNAAPTITASGPAICNGNGVTLTSNASTGNVWSTGATTQSITVTTAGTYTLTNNNGTCTSSAASFTVVNGVDPNLQITGNLTFCENSSTILNATAQGTGNTFSWSNGTTGATATIISLGTYTVTVTTSLGCQYQKSVTVTMDPLIVVNIASPAQITCTNPQITLDATSSIYQTGATYLWTASGGGNIVSGANTLTPTVNNGGTYTLKITSATPNGCVKQASVNVVKNISPPTIILTSSKMTICKGESAIITASGAVSYVWVGLSGSGNTQTVTPLTTTTYFVTGTGTNGCVSSAPTTITINVVPEITSILQDTEICEGHKANLDAGTALSGPSYTYSWSTGETTQVIHPTAAGTYSVTISNGFCSKTFSAKVSYTIVPEILEIVYNNNSLTIKAKNNSPLPLEYSIDNGVIWQASNVFTNVLKNTQYPIRVRNRGILCDAYTEYYTFVLSNAITPNGDGINDVLDLTPLSKYKNFTGSVFDRYGKEIFKASAKNTIWDGKYVGREAPTGTYWYKLSWEDPVTKKTIMLNGWVLLKNRD
ncbi:MULTISPECIES: T9SS type B sorting domain-containing protein [unclassified Chryseobacterium]|uniref:T9SS type B sorting domain-containing protein n=1 Tax=unclassified Chryseobacterium TaxID=2593645 RepID=UPI00226AD7C9|nr:MULTISPECIES: T9SS type B sorting domain-containing protein [unclassified Chryseobacterium]